MNKFRRLIPYFNNIHIYSAMLWAITIVLCSYYHKSDNLSNILITAAGFHVLLMYRFNKTTKKERAKYAC